MGKENVPFIYRQPVDRVDLLAKVQNKVGHEHHNEPLLGVCLAFQAAEA
jgi:anthranilate/para-aminobenzoate synthase component II